MRVWMVIAAVLMAGPVQAEAVLAEAAGNWAAPQNDGFYYRAVLTEEGATLRLRIWQGMTAEGLEDEPQFDTAGIMAAGDRTTLEVGQTGELVLISTTRTDGHLYSERLTIRMIDFQFTAVAYLWSNDWTGGAREGDIGCLSEACYACEADLWGGSAVAGGEAVAVPEHDFEALNASYWSPSRAVELGFCPGPD